ncbi:hypothetical protein BXY82_1591 [Gelidibacter sediminis]|uniref:Uncharacterized protein n=1 Tax=Gelidibacter sediminis TaxID=1608710 RepID=A0A4R7PX86_9FLAO|nr:hypothetical protein BXY82_1591 [Gelidibacter sediminis]
MLSQKDKILTITLWFLLALINYYNFGKVSNYSIVKLPMIT